MKNLTRTYVVALSVIALVIGFSQFLIQSSITNSSSDSRIINISGRQRMLSQKIAKASLAMRNADNVEDYLARKEELEKAYTLWSESHTALQFGSEKMEMTNVNNTPAILDLFQQIEPHFLSMEQSVESILSIDYEQRLGSELQIALESVLANEGDFLKLMNDITFEYDAEALGRVKELSRNEYILFAIALILLIAEALVVFRPAINRIAEYTKKLQSQGKSLKRALGQSQYLTNQAKSVFENVDQGIFLLNEKFGIDSFYSKETERVLGESELAGANFIHLMKSKLMPRDIEALELYTENLFNTDIREDVVNRLNPIEQVEIFTEKEGSKAIESRYLRVSFSRIMRSNQIYRILVTVLDETESVLLKKQIEEAEVRNERESAQLLAIFKVNPRVLHEYLDTTMASLGEISKMYERDGNESLKELIGHTFRVVHSAKGNATLINLDLVQDRLHELEDSITLLKEKRDIKGKDFLNVIYEVTEIIMVLDNMKAMLKKIANVYKTWNQAESSNPNAVLTETLKKGVDRLSRSQKKEVDFIFEDNGIQLPEQFKIDFKDLSIQLIRNSLVHGIESEDERNFMGKNASAEIRISLEESKGGEVIVHYEDNGKGLDLDEIVSKAIDKSIINAAEADDLDDHQKASLIFHDGFSTAEQVSELAGRGQGMSVIRSIIDKHKGKFILDSKKDEYFRMSLTFPKRDEHVSVILKQAV